MWGPERSGGGHGGQPSSAVRPRSRRRPHRPKMNNSRPT
ncbi:hypothetical protein GJR88_04429 [Dietzia sp. DQ12-45-1b]|nr:hypothetical protein GJR88_04429 [Dietzia sp. DQ12-45-1b]